MIEEADQPLGYWTEKAKDREWVSSLTPGERVQLTDLLSHEAYGYTVATAPRLRRDIARVIRPGDPEAE
jgi:hypothetical protein